MKSKSVSVRLEDTSSLADQVNSSKMARVLTSETLVRFDANHLQDIKLLIWNAIEDCLEVAKEGSRPEKSLRKDLELLQSINWVSDVQRFAPSFNNGFSLVEDEKLKPYEKMALSAIQRGNKYICRVMQSAGIETLVVPRKIYAGESDSEAWTDGVSYICINRKHLRACHKGPDRFWYAVQLLVHEYIHECEDNQRHNHDALFHADFHRAVMHVQMKGACSRDLYGVSTMIASYYVQELLSSNFKVPESFAQFGGIARDAYRELSRLQSRTRRELARFKMGSPWLDDAGRLCFYTFVAGKTTLEFHMTCAGPVLRFCDKELLLSKERMAVEERRYYGKNGVSAEFWLRSGYSKSGIEGHEIFYNMAISDEQAAELASLLDAHIYFDPQRTDEIVRPAPKDNATDNHALYNSDLFQKHLKAWAKREPVLAEYCGREPLSCKDWYQIVVSA